MSKYLTYLIAVAFLPVSCEYEKEIELNIFPGKACLNAVVQQDSLISFLLFRTLGDGGPVFIPDAELSVRVNGQVCSTGPVAAQPGQYILPDYRASGGDLIEVLAHIPSYDPLQAETVVPYAPEILSVDVVYWEEERFMAEEPYLHLNGTLRFRDPSGDKKYYILFFLHSYSYPDGEAMEWDYAYTAIDKTELTNHPEFYRMHTFIYDFGLVENNYYSGGNYYLFSCDLSRDGIYEIPFSAYDLEPLTDNGRVVEHTSFRVCLYSVSLSYFLYLQSRYNQNRNGEGWGNEYILEPLPTFTNVKGGYGLLSALSETNYIVTRELLAYP